MPWFLAPKTKSLDTVGTLDHGKATIAGKIDEIVTENTPHALTINSSVGELNKFHVIDSGDHAFGNVGVDDTSATFEVHRAFNREHRNIS